MDKKSKLTFAGLLFAVVAHLPIIRSAAHAREEVRDVTGLLLWGLSLVASFVIAILNDPLSWFALALLLIAVAACRDDIRAWLTELRSTPTLPIGIEAIQGPALMLGNDDQYDWRDIQFGRVRLTNKSSNGMSLSFRCKVTYPIDDDEIDFFWSKGEIREPYEHREYSSLPKSETVNLPAHSSTEVGIGFGPLTPTQAKIKTWDGKATDRRFDLEVEVTDHVSGLSVLTNGWRHPPSTNF